MPEPTWASSIDWRVRPARRLRVRVGTDSAAVPKVLDELRVGLRRTSPQTIRMVAERRKSRREAQRKVYLADGSDVQCGARSACWKQLELDVAAAADCVWVKWVIVGLGQCSDGW